MAADRPYLAGPVADKPAAFARQERDVFVHAALFTLNYLAFAEDGTLEITPPHPRHEGESAQDAEQRLRAEMALSEARVLAGNWCDLSVDEPRQIPPS